MNSADEILRVAERLYAAVAAPEQWPAALAGVTDLLGGSHATLNVHGTEPMGSAFIANARLDQRDLARVLSPDAMRELHPLLDAMPLGIANRSTVISDADFERSALYNEVFRPLNGFRSLHFRQNGAGGAFLLSVCRPQRADDFDARDRAALQLLVPHLRTAVALQSRLQNAEHRSAGLARVLERLDGGVIVTDAGARPLMLNARAERIIADADGLALDAAGLAAATPTATQQLHEAIAAMARDAAVEGRRIRLDRPSQRLPLLLSVLPIGRLGAVVPGAGAPRVAIFITEPDAPPPIDRLAVAEAFRLTRRESEIAVLLADGLDTATIASRLGTSLATVRDHLKHVFEKTGVRSQVALVALLRGFVERMH